MVSHEAFGYLLYLFHNSLSGNSINVTTTQILAFSVLIYDPESYTPPISARPVSLAEAVPGLEEDYPRISCSAKHVKNPACYAVREWWDCRLR
jgi:hypothetical protein